MDIYFFEFLTQKSSEVGCYNLGVLKKRQRTYPKRNEQQGARALAAIDIFVKHNHPLQIQKKCSISTVPFFIFATFIF